jgi:hypothetical protein
MSLYKNSSFDIFPERSKKPLLLALIVFVVIVGGYLIVSSIDWSHLFVFEKSNISAKFEDNPIYLIKKNNTLLMVTVNNNSDTDAFDSIVKINSVESGFIIFCPDSNSENKREITIPIIAKDNKRVIKCDIRADPSKSIMEGTYSFDIQYILNNELTSKRITLGVKS